MIPVGPEKASPVEYFGFSKAAGVMKQMVKDSANNPGLIRQALQMIRRVDGGSYTDEAKVIFQYVRDCIRYASDVSAQDIYRDPLLTLDLKAGDCNNKVVLGCSLAKAVGFPTRLVFVFNKPAGETDEFPFHVYYQVDITKGESTPPNWVSCETIPVPSGRPGVMGPDRKLEFGWNLNSGFPEYVEVDK